MVQSVDPSCRLAEWSFARGRGGTNDCGAITMPIIIYGSRGVYSELSSGDFSCPHCRRGASYRLRQIRRYFTLFFLPIFPIGSGVRFVECDDCGSQFNEEVLDYRQAPADDDEALLRAAMDQLKEGQSLEAVRDQLAKQDFDPGQAEAFLVKQCERSPRRCDRGLRYHPSVTRCADCGKEL
jgi:hypothetical protein